uniref:C2H2-type domain-containing protein n=1 Tax=Angiostrongylus cantonensis TaxID=6313 RepID=A0A0K0DCD5_ANGCA
MDRQKVLNMKLQMKSDGVKLACIKCGEIPTNIDKHLKEVHDVKTSADWLKNIRVVRDEGGRSFRYSVVLPNKNASHIK